MNEIRYKELRAALLSGAYKKGVGHLRTTHPVAKDGFCCLGVACNLHAQAHPDIASREKVPQKYLGNSDYLPGLVRDWFGMKSHDGRFGETYSVPGEDCTDQAHRLSGKQCYNLAQINDCTRDFKHVVKALDIHWRTL